MFPIRSAVPYRYAPVVTWAVIVANCVVFLAQTSLDPADLQALVYAFGLVPARYLGLFSGGSGGPRLDDFLPFVTMMFLHAGWLHLIFNMWTLWLFGPTIEDRLGHGRYAVFYFCCGVAAVAGPCRLQCHIDRSGAGRVRRDCGRARMLHGSVSVRSRHRARADFVSAALFRNARHTSLSGSGS